MIKNKNRNKKVLDIITEIANVDLSKIKLSKLLLLAAPLIIIVKPFKDITQTVAFTFLAYKFIEEYEKNFSVKKNERKK